MQTPNPNFQDIEKATDADQFDEMDEQLLKDADIGENEREDGSFADDENVSFETSNEEQMGLLRAEIEDLKQQVLRSYADLQNFRKRSLAQVDEARKYANEDLLTQLIPVLDNFERTFKAIEGGTTLENVLEGINMVQRQFGTVLQQNELVRITSVGQQFDPHLHEAVIIWESPDHADGTITDELEAGYTMRDRVVRPAKVRVVRGG